MGQTAIWAAAVVIVLIVGMCMFRKPLSDLIERVRNIRYKDAELALDAPQVRPNAGVPREGQLITRQDVIDAFRGVEFLKPEDIEPNAAAVQAYLIKSGIIVNEQLQGLVSSQDILAVLRDIYVRELKRDPVRPLDPLALASWGAALYIHGMTEEMIRAVTNAVRRTPEYRAMNSGG